MVNTSVLIYFEQTLAVRINIYFLNIPDTQNNDILWIKMLRKWSKPCNIFNFFSLSVEKFSCRAAQPILTQSPGQRFRVPGGPAHRGYNPARST